MENKNQLKSLNRMVLMGNLKSLVKKEKNLTLEILDYLQEVSNRKLFLEMGYSSLFTFLTDELGYCSGTAYLKIQTMKALTIPENRERVLKDKTSLNSLAKTQSFINNENKELNKQLAPPLTEKEKQELFTAAEGVPANKVETILKEKKHEMEVKKSTEQGLPPPIKKILKKFYFEADQELVNMIDELKSLLSHTCPAGDLADVLKKVFPLSIQEIKVKKGLIKRSESRGIDLKKKESSDIEASSTALNLQNENSGETKISMTLQNCLMNQNSKSHKINSDKNSSSMKSLKDKSQNLVQMIQINSTSLEEAKQQAAPQNIQNNHTSKNIDKKSVSSTSLNKSWEQKRILTRSIPLELKRKIWKRDGGCCQYQDPQTGKQCGSKHQLEVDHLRPWSMGGDHSLENLWVLCRNHNMYRWHSIKN